jgi:hypothetical protein
VWCWCSGPTAAAFSTSSSPANRNGAAFVRPVRRRRPRPDEEASLRARKNALSGQSAFESLGLTNATGFRRAFLELAASSPRDEGRAAACRIPRRQFFRQLDANRAWPVHSDSLCEAFHRPAGAAGVRQVQLIFSVTATVVGLSCAVVDCLIIISPIPKRRTCQAIGCRARRPLAAALALMVGLSAPAAAALTAEAGGGDNCGATILCLGLGVDVHPPSHYLDLLVGAGSAMRVGSRWGGPLHLSERTRRRSSR